MTMQSAAPRSKRILMVGAPGSGKGTQADSIAKQFGITHIASGDLLRRHIADGTAIGKTVEDIVNKGELVPDALIMDMLRKPVMAANETGGYVLDGFPRTVEQAEAAYRTAGTLGVGVQIAVHLEVPEEELIRRLLARARGADDTEDVIRHRIKVYEEKTRPLLEYYASRETLIQVNGARPISEVTWSIVVQLQRAFKKPSPRQATAERAVA
ncbi:adenylate kinase [Dactylosporangium matsuzakiense]|uniref:Adenylate kinase n=1 Tax=Dactylosporangium matsuzakiense TaxID=53360 RepID=A0A9W6NL68_9ACTN|nr:adenylate kinase [Dactylosporangium matsuzakiense]UWZ48937.1 adenylate kinase [Dactylosporangium matsuzakiense]GLL00836.1 adenylate kinase [Dactylosporangium matsuzakiense]